MPKTTVYFFREATGRTPVLDWLTDLRASDRRAYTKCVAAIRQLASEGHEYFFCGRNIAVVAHGATKEDVVHPSDIERAITRMRFFERDPRLHASLEDLP